MEETKTPETPAHTCPECEKRSVQHKQNEQAGLEILVALMPLLTITFLGNLGLF